MGQAVRVCFGQKIQHCCVAGDDQCVDFSGRDTGLAGHFLQQLVQTSLNGAGQHWPFPLERGTDPRDHIRAPGRLRIPAPGLCKHVPAAVIQTGGQCSGTDVDGRTPTGEQRSAGMNVLLAAQHMGLRFAGGGDLAIP